ncbi:Exosome complex component rrp4 [Sorochytrium milnesiophthora]
MDVKILLPRRLPSDSAHDAEDNDGDEIMLDASLHIVTPGETITTDPQFMRGHGTYTLASISHDVVSSHQQLRTDQGDDDDEDEAATPAASVGAGGPPGLVSSVAGVVQRVNKLVSVKPLRSRFTGDVGDVVVGRVLEIGQKRWKLDINSRQDGILLLSSVNLPGGIQRRKQESDELQMRTFFTEGDLLVAEVQQFYHDGAIGLHTRSTKYGKLANGSLLIVPHTLVKRLPTHFHSLSCGVDVILGLNGYIWVSKTDPANGATATPAMDPYSGKELPISVDERTAIARVCNAVTALARNNTLISDTAIVYVYEASLNYSVQDMLDADVASEIVGISGLQRSQQQKQQFKSAGTQLAQSQLAQLTDQMRTFKDNLQQFAQQYRAEIARDPHFRQRFQSMCNSIGVDPLASSKGFWGELLGVGDFYYELGVLVSETCLATREQNGGVMAVQEVQRTVLALRRQTSGVTDDITADDIKRAVKLLSPLGNGFRVVQVAGREWVQSVPQELNGDVAEALVVAETNGGMVDAQRLRAQLKWTDERVAGALESLVRDGLVWVDEQTPAGQGPAYWALGMTQFSS